MDKNILNVDIQHSILNRIIALILSFLLFFGNVDLFNCLISKGEEVYSNNLDGGFYVEAFWKDTDSLDYEWNASKTESRSPRLVLMYSNPSIQRTIYKGDIQFIVPCFGDVLRDKYDKNVEPVHNVDTEWKGEYLKKENQYIYTYDGDTQVAGSLSGGFELVWNLNSRECENGYSKSESVQAKIRKRDENGNILLNDSGEEIWETIQLPPLNFSFTSERDNYVVDVQQDGIIDFINPNDYYEYDNNYIWYDIKSEIKRTEIHSRGLEMSSYYLDITPENLPEGVDASQIYIRYGDTYKKLGKLPQYETGTYRFEPADFQNMLGDFDYKELTINIGIPQDMDFSNSRFNITGHLNRLYKDDTTWETGNVDEKNPEIDNPQDSSSIVISSSTKDDYNQEVISIGMSSDISVNHYKNNPYQRENNRLNSLELFNDKIVNFTLTGSVSKGENYSLVMGDDLLIIQTENGTYRKLEPNEYEIVGITMPAYKKYIDVNNPDGVGYNYTITIDNNDTITTDSSGQPCSTKSEQYYPLSGCHSIKIKIDDITGKMDYKPIIKVKFSFNENSSFIQTGKIVNFSYFTILDSSGNPLLPLFPNSFDYTSSNGTNIVQHFDRENHAEQPNYIRAESPVLLREPQVTITSSTKFLGFEDNGITDPNSSKKKSNDFTSTITTSGTITSDVETNLTKFSLYTVIPSSLDFNIYDEQVKVSGSYCKAFNGQRFDNFDGRVEFSTRVYDDDNTLVIANFYFDDEPVLVSPSQNVNISVSYPVKLSYPTYIVRQNNTYIAESYTMVHDNVNNLKGNNNEPSNIDIDGDGNLNEVVAKSSASRKVIKVASSWEEYAPKYVKSSYSNGYVKETHVKIKEDDDTPESDALTRYSYRLDFQMGNDNADELIFFDDLEKEEGSEWQGTFQGIDISPTTSNFDALDLNATLYYSTVDSPTHDITSGEWQPYNEGTTDTIKSIAVVVRPNSGVIKYSTYLYFTINMQAPSYADKLDTTAINKFQVNYLPIDRNSGKKSENYTIVNSDTVKVTLKNQTVKLTLTKTDYNKPIKIYYDSEGNIIRKHYLPIEGAKFKFTDTNTNKSFEKEVNSRGVLVLDDLQEGIYNVEEIITPEGYQTIAPFIINIDYSKEDTNDIVTLSNENQMITNAGGIRLVNTKVVNNVKVYEYELEVPNERIPGKVKLEKSCNNQLQGNILIKGAKYEIYTSNDKLVLTDENNIYSEDGAKSVFETNGDGIIEVTNLPWGNYYFLEKEAPEGYQLNYSKVEFTIDAETVSTEDGYTICNTTDLEQLTKVILIKEDEENHNRLKGASFELEYFKNGDWYHYYSCETSTSGQFVIDGIIPFGTYRFKEISPPEGYEIDKNHQYFPSKDGFELDGKNLTFTVTATNKRKLASVELIKRTQDGNNKNAKYGLYKVVGEMDKIIKPDENGYPVDIDTDEDIRNYPAFVQVNDDIKIGRVSPEQVIENVTNNLEWGDYYFIEEVSPLGYFYNHEPVKFTLNAQHTDVPLQVFTTDERATGTVELKKVSEADNTILLANAHYRLYTNSGEMIYTNVGQNGKYEYNKDGTNNEFITNDNGIIKVTNLPWGAYYFEEIKAPDGYGINPDKVRFSVDNTNSQSVQKLVCEDPVKTSQIKINKIIDSRIDAYGNPTFIFQIDKLDSNSQVEKSWTKMITITSGLSSSTILAGLNPGIYRISELPVSRYTIKSASAVDPSTDIDTDPYTVTLNLTADTDGEVSFENNLNRYDKYSHSSSAVNVISRGRKLTSISAKLKTPIISATAKNPTYTLTNDDIEVYAIYDDNSKELLSMSDTNTIDDYINHKYTMDISSREITATDIIQYKKINLSYAEGGISVSTMVILQIDALSIPDPITVYFHANGGYFGTTDDQTPIYKVKFTYDADTETMQPDKDINPIPKNINTIYSFTGWYDKENPDEQEIQVDTDTLFTNIKNGTETNSNYELYAKWVEGNAQLLGGRGKWTDQYPYSYLLEKFIALSGGTENITAIKQSLFVPEDITVEELVNISTLTISPDTTTKDDMLNYCVSDDKTGAKTFPIFAWFKDGTIYWWSKDMTPKMSKVSDRLFDQCKNIQDISGVRNWDASEVENMEGMFCGVCGISSIEALKDWDTSKVKNMRGMFWNNMSDASHIENLDPLKNWNTSNLENMYQMFYNCENLADISGIYNWDTSKVTTMFEMFGCDDKRRMDNLKSIDGLNWNITALTNAKEMFQRTGLESINNVTFTDNNTLGSKKLEVSCMFQYCDYLTSITGLNFDTQNVTNMSTMFGAGNTTAGRMNNISGLKPNGDKIWNVSRVTNMNKMFYNQDDITSFNDIKDWHVENVTNFVEFAKNNKTATSTTAGFSFTYLPGSFGSGGTYNKSS